MYDLIFVAILTFILIYVLVKGKPQQSGTASKFIVKQKTCPPHQWYWQDIVDEHGEKHGERIVCKVCGPLSKLIDGSIE